jgi:hypothetical protein
MPVSAMEAWCWGVCVWGGCPEPAVACCSNAVREPLADKAHMRKPSCGGDRSHAGRGASAAMGRSTAWGACGPWPTAYCRCTSVLSRSDASRGAVIRK